MIDVMISEIIEIDLMQEICKFGCLLITEDFH